MTPNKEDYLKCIYEIQERQIKCTNKQIAEMMAVSAPSVSEMVKKLCAENLIAKDSHTGYYLTEQGKTTVSQLYRKHRLIEVFLVNHLHYTRHDIHEEAEVLEHTVSDLFIDRLEESLNFPETCPHGGTIPRKNQDLEERYKLLLAEVKLPGQFILRRVYDQDLLLKYMTDHHLTLGLTFSLLQYDDFGKTWTITFDDKELTIPETVATKLFVEEITPNKNQKTS